MEKIKLKTSAAHRKASKKYYNIHSVEQIKKQQDRYWKTHTKVVYPHLTKEQISKYTIKTRRVGKNIFFTNKFWENAVVSNRCNDRGYVKINFVGCKNYCTLEHTWVMMKDIGRELTSTECVHHKDENRSNNKLNNLQLMTRKEHAKLHKMWKDRKNLKI